MKKEQVLGMLRIITKMDEDELAPYNPLIENYMAPYLKKEYHDEEDRKLVMLVAAQVNYQIQIANSGDDITSFSAGEVKVTKNGNGSLALAQLIYSSALEDAAGLVEDKGFSFLGV